MLGIVDYGAFVAAFVLLLFLPGPGNLALITSTGQGGLAGGMASVLGLLVGDQILMWMTVAGVATVLAANPAIFAVFQWLGAAYLAWLGGRMLLAKAGGKPLIAMRAGDYFQQTLMITLFNPKAIMFYVAFFPQFIDPVHHQGLVTFAVMSLTVALLGFAYCAGVVILTHTMAEKMKANPRFTTLVQKLAGALLIGFGARLVFAK